MDKYVSAIITAAGMGTRVGADVPKLELELKGIRIIDQTVEIFKAIDWIDQLIIVTSQDLLEAYEDRYSDEKTAVILGGTTREESTYNGLMSVDKKADYVITHDGARPYVTEDLITRVYKMAEDYGAAIAAVPATDTIKVVKNGRITKTLDRSKLFNIQTPQVFKRGWIIEGYEKYLGKIQVTDDSSFVEALERNVYVAEGSYDNIKITTKEDLE